MSLFIDSGNTFTKIAKRSDRKFEILSRVESNRLELLSKYLNAKEPHVYISSVSAKEKELEEICNANGVQPIFMDAESRMPFSTNYPLERLGQDRKALIAGASASFPKKDVLIISAGTCITMDLLSRENIHLGGRISPGLRMRFQAMHEFTGALPLIDPSDTYSFLGMDTEHSIRSGAQLGILLEIEGIIQHLKKEFPHLRVILSGGDCPFFEKLIKVEIFADPLILFKGLYEIYKLNARK